MKRKMNRREFIRFVIAGGAAGTAAMVLPRLAFPETRMSKPGNASETAAKRPNIVLIMADDMGFSDAGCYGGEIHTPNIDRLADGGLRFTQFYNAARCCPTRASLLTGLYSHQAGVGSMNENLGTPSYQGYLNDRCVTIAEVLKTAGYRTLMTGKWHVGDERGHWPLDRGFERFYGTPKGGGVYFWPPSLDKSDKDIVLNNKVVTPRKQWYSTDAFTDYAISFMEEAHKESRPFFLYVAHIAPHFPLQAWPEDIAKYKGKYMKGWDALRLERHSRMIKMGIVDKAWPLTPRGKWAKPWDQLDMARKEEMDLRMAIYAAQIDRMDQGIGRVMAKLKELGIEENTLVLFLSDNGGCAEGGPWGFTRRKGTLGTVDSFASYGLSWANASNTPFRKYKRWVHEGGIATPLIAYWPAVIRSAGGITHQVGHVIDLLPTCLDAAGTEYPKTYKGKKIIPVEGRSLLPILHGKQRTGQETLFWEHIGNRAVRQGKWKLVARHRGRWELYDLKADRTELNNLAQKYPQKVEQLKAMYESWAERCDVRRWPIKNTKNNKM